MTIIDYTPYVRPPRLSAAGGVVLGSRLILAAPKDLTPSAKKALKRVRECTVRVQTVSKERDRLRPESLRPLDQRFDNCWRALQARIQAWVIAGLAQADQAQALLDTLSLSSLDFLLIDYESEWVESSKRLERIDEEGHAHLIEKLAGAAFLAEVRDAHRSLGDALGLGEAPRETASSTAMADAIADLANAISQYCRQLLAVVDDNDPSLVSWFLAAVAPLDAYRQASSPSSSDGNAPTPQPDPNQPVPTVR